MSLSRVRSSIWFCYWVFNDKSARRSQLTLMKKCFPFHKIYSQGHFTLSSMENLVCNKLDPKTKKCVVTLSTYIFNYYITLSFNGHIDSKRKDNWKLLSDFLISDALESFPLTEHLVTMIMMVNVNYWLNIVLVPLKV